MNTPKTYEECLLYMEGEEAKSLKPKTPEAWDRYHYALRYIKDYKKALRTIALAKDILKSPEYQKMWSKNSDASIQNAIQIIRDNS